MTKTTISNLAYMCIQSHLYYAWKYLGTDFLNEKKSLGADFLMFLQCYVQQQKYTLFGGGGGAKRGPPVRGTCSKINVRGKREGI